MRSPLWCHPVATALLAWTFAAVPSALTAVGEEEVTPPSVVTVRVDWSKAGAEVAPGAYGLNVFGGVDPLVAGAPRYRENLAYLRPGLLRVHSWNMMQDAAKSPEGWLDYGRKSWDAERVRAVIAALPPDTTDGSALLINIPGWPEWMKKTADGRLDPSEHAAYARWCADLVRIVNVEGKRPVRLWEITNERDEVYWVNAKKANQPDALEELVRLYNQCAVAMKAVDPAIQTGGPAATRSDFVADLRRFVRGTRANLDFFSGHVYASGDADDADAAVFARPRAWGKLVGQLTTMLREESPDRVIPLFVNEFNISWTWETRDPRMRNFKGAVFDALTLGEMVTAGAAATNAWNECDGTYGKMDHGKDDNFALRPAADVYHLFNRYFRPGRVVETLSSKPERLAAFAVAADGDTTRALALTNPGAGALRVRVEAAGPPAVSGSSVASHVVDASGHRETRLDPDAVFAREFTLPPFSVSVYVLRRE